LNPVTRYHTYPRLENNEYMCRFVVRNRQTLIAIVVATCDTPEPFANNAADTQVTNHVMVIKRLEIVWRQREYIRF
jgi:hypothetical protein